MELIQYKDATITREITHPAIKKVVEFLSEHDVASEEKGTHIVSDDFFYNVIEMETTSPDQRVWESHKAFYDVHVIFEGQERISYNHLSNMRLRGYDADGDWQQMDGLPLFDILFTPGTILLLDPNDAHKTGLSVVSPKYIKKVVFKVKL